MQVGVVDPGETSRVMTVPVDEMLDPANRFLLRHATGWTGPAFQHDDLVVWGFTAGILAAMFHSAGWELNWDTSDIRDLEKTLAASANGERHEMSAEEARREASDPLADRTVAGVPGVSTGLPDEVGASDDDHLAGSGPGRRVPEDDDEEPLDLPADDPRRGYR